MRLVMKQVGIVLLSLLLCMLIHDSGIAQEEQHSQKSECDKLVFVESPYSDVTVSRENDTLSLGHANSLELRGQPDRKCMIPVLGYEVHHIDAEYVNQCFLKVYTVSKKKSCRVTLLGTSLRISEDELTWRNFAQNGEVLAAEVLENQDYLIFDITDFARRNLKEGMLTFFLQSDGKKTVDIASRESGLSAELIFEMCSKSRQAETVQKLHRQEKATMQILPNALEGKLTVQLSGVPAGGFADLMIMDDAGNILQHVPLAIRDGIVLTHSIDFGELLPGHYWALFRKGRVMIRNEFMIAPSREQDRLLEVQLVADNSKASKQ